MRVRSNLADKSKIALWERNPAHPTGEVLITGEQAFEVGDTPAIRAALRLGTLVKAGEAVVSEPPKPKRRK